MTIRRPGTDGESPLAEPFELTAGLRLRNRLVATAHGRAAVYDGLPSAHDADYWRRLSSGGVAMCIAGGTVVGPTSTYRTRMLTEAWRPEALPGLRMRAEAMHEGGAAAVLQILHLGRETLGAEIYYAPVAPSRVRSPREPTAPRVLTDDEIDDVVEGFRLAALNAAEAGFDGIELHAAHGYLLGQFLAPASNRRPGAEALDTRLEPLARIAEAVRGAAGDRALGIRMSVGDPDDSGLTFDQLAELLPRLDAAVDYVNLTVGMRADYVRDMATTRPPLLEEIGRLRTLTKHPLLISHGFRDAKTMESALAAGADLVGMARALIADPDLPRKVLEGRRGEVRPCVACNEDCRAFDPALLCTVNPDLAAPGDRQRRAAPLIRGGDLRASPQRVAVVGAGPGGLETALTLARADSCDVVLFDQHDAIGGAIGLVGTAPNRSGWLRIVDFYERNLAPERVELQPGRRVDPADLADFDAVVIATGSEEVLPDAAAGSPARTVSDAIAAGPEALRGVSRLVVVDDGFAWWPSVNALELAVAGGVGEVVVVTPGTAFAMGIPGEARVQLLKRLRGAIRLGMRPMTAFTGASEGSVELRSNASGETERVEADVVIVVGERRPRDWSRFEDDERGIVVIGDCIVPRRVAHAITEGRAAAGTVLAGRAVPAGEPVATTA
jgi:2,4-dienoyl-CoA reductase-like NADH-dependent reductase (Old Yellow Enzyme family)/thioredoxin reductase